MTKVNHPDLLDLASDTGATVFPKGTTAERPVSPEAGYIRFNTDGNIVETYDGTSWLSIDYIKPTYTIDYLSVAGGGGGGGRGGGGAGGGVLESYFEADKLETYSFVVGSGGSGATVGSQSSGISGTNSVISSAAFSSITSIGGGAGGGFDLGGVAGGSGGGAGRDASYNVPGGSGTLGQGFAGGYSGEFGASRDAIGCAGGGGGGGAGGIGGNGTVDDNRAGAAGSGVVLTSGERGGEGGTGKESTITGIATFYAGGGGGGNGCSDSTTVNYGLGGNGGGGHGNDMTSGRHAASGTANTGGGGGASGDDYTSYTAGSGGSGVVILRMPTADYSGTTTGSPTVTTNGTNTILTYTTSGTYTA